VFKQSAALARWARCSAHLGVYGMHRGHRRILSKRSSAVRCGLLKARRGSGLRKKAERAMMKDGNP
jgi:hypothetical protein